MTMPTKETVSIVIPVYNEEAVINKFYDRLIAVLSRLDYGYEIIFIDDGSFDKTLDILCGIAKKDGRVKIISFSRNFGHMIALSAGLDHASGKAVITMDSDLQHPPELIPALINKWSQGAIIVNTIKESTKNISIFKKNVSKLFYWFMKRIVRIDIAPHSADFRLIDHSIVEELKQMKERARFLRGLISWLGYKQEFISYRADMRVSGKSKYSFIKMLSFAIDGITSFSSLPLRISTYCGMVIASLSFLYMMIAVYFWFLHKTFPGWTSIVVVVLFIGGLQLIFLGIMGEYLARIYEEVRERPLYIVKKKLGF